MIVVLSVIFIIFLTFLFLTWTTNIAVSSAEARQNMAKSFILDLSLSLFLSLPSRVTASVLGSLFFTLAILNFIGNVPLINIPTMYYYFTFSLSLTLWLSIMTVVFYTQFRDFLAHMLPFGAPSALILFLPLVEVFSHIIRPLTLIIRLSTNLSSGHIIIYMFSFFSVSSNLLTFVLTFVLFALLVLELCISVLQAYIFSSLVSMYLTETHCAF